MNYPLISEYIEAIKAAEDNFDELSYLRPVLDDDGIPVMSAGGFSVVFKMKDERNGKLYAVKCFTKEQEGRAEAYHQIAEELEYVSSTFLTPIKYLDKELFVDTSSSDETEFPVLLMDWVEGQTLDKYIREHIDDEYELSLLAYQFSRLAMWLLPQPFAHGDLKPDNILVKDDGTLVLVDYDGMYVPAMKGQKARELGSPDFRHPSRTEANFDEHIDDFSLASILLSLKAIALQPELLEQYGAKDRLLFSERDYRDISQCQLLKDVFPSTDSELNIMTSLFMLALDKSNLNFVSFRLFNLSRPQVPIIENLCTEVTEEDLENAWIDEYGVKYSADRKRLLKASEGLAEYSIRKGTIVVCKRAFDFLEFLTSIHIPNSVTNIGEEAFSWCSALTSIHIPDSVTSIEKSAFSRCKSLSSIVVDKNNKYYDSRGNCNAIIESKSNTLIAGCNTTIIPDSVTSIGESAFKGCSSLSYIHIPDSVTSIGERAFNECYALISIHIPDSVTSIGKSAFSCCSSLTSIHIPDSVTSIGESAFSRCESLTSIVVDKNNKYYDSRGNCNAIIESKNNTLIASCSTTIIPDSVTSIGESAFTWCTLTSIHIPNSVTGIGDNAFRFCESLTSIHIPDSVTSIGESAFFWCRSLVSVHIPNSVTSIGEQAFNWCSLTSIHIPDGTRKKFEKLLPYYKDILVEQENPKELNTEVTEEDLANAWTDEYGVKYSADRKRLLKVPCHIRTYSIAKGTRVIANSAFSSCGSLANISIPDSVTSIGELAFGYCRSLTSISIPNSVTSIGEDAFGGCSSLTRISIPNSVTSIGDWAFDDCDMLTSIIIPLGTKKKFEELLPYDKDELVEE